jgi:hypothetical protein
MRPRQLAYGKVLKIALLRQRADCLILRHSDFMEHLDDGPQE